MKIEKNLVEKIKETLREPTAEELFPNLIEYLKEEYGSLAIGKMPEQTNQQTWIISRTTPTIKKTLGAIPIGVIKSYVKEKAISAEYGYQAEVVTKGKRLKLKYRKGYLILDTSSGFIVTSKDLQRYDKENIPFP